MLRLQKIQRGFSLLEVVIALFVLSVGMLGSTAMVLRGQNEARETNYESIASMLAQTMADRMRANIQGVNSGAYDGLNSGIANPGCIATGCNSNEIAAYDSFEWGRELAQWLPDGVGTVRVVGPGAQPDSVFNINVTWTAVQSDDHSGSDTAGGTEITKTYTMMLQP